MTNGIQHHFYLETQTAIAIPEDGDALRVIASTQGPAPTRDFLSSFLQMPANKIVVETRRDGGSYGGKYVASRRNCATTTAVAKILGVPAR
jgi:xanthine dehydrogenase molybdopterin-binding subunit B